MEGKITEEKGYKSSSLLVFKIALPLTFQQILSSAGTMIDNLMLGKLGR